MASGRKAPRGPRGGCSRGSVKVSGYKVTKKIKVKGKRTKKTIKYTVSPYCRKKAAGSASSKRKSGRKAMHSKASANFVCQSKSTKKFTRRKANGQCRAGSKKIRI